MDSGVWKLLRLYYYITVCAQVGGAVVPTCMSLCLTASNSFYNWNSS